MNYYAEEIADVLDSGTAVLWPYADGTHAMPSPNAGTTLPAIAALGGYVILGNIGQSTTYTSADGSVVIHFGASYDGTQWILGTPSSGTFTVAGVTYSFSGPYCAIDPAVIDLEDAGFTNIAEVDEINPFADVYTGEYPTRPRSGHIRTLGAHYADKSQALRHQHVSHHSRGHFTGASLMLQRSSASGYPSVALYIVPNGGSTSESMYWVSDDGNGDTTNGTPAGCYLIEPPNPYASSDTPKWHPATGVQGLMAFDFTVPSPAAASIGNTLITFSNVFPIAFSGATTTDGSGTVHYFRYCYYTTVNGKTIESALSPLSIGVACSTNCSLGIPAVPAGWSGVHVYVDGGIGDPPRFLCGTSSVTTAQTLTVNPAGTTNTIASRGFTIWPQGTNIATTTGNQFLVKVGHTSAQADSANSTYTLTSHLGGAAGATRSQITPGPANTTLVTNAAGEVVWSTAGGLPPGANGEVLSFAGGTIAWTAAGLSGNILTSNGTALPTWSAVLALNSATVSPITGNGSSGQNGVTGITDTGNGVYGTASGSGTGVDGVSSSGYGVLGATTSGAAGVRGNAGSTAGVIGFANAASVYGVYGSNDFNNASVAGVFGEAIYGYGVLGESTNGVGVYGSASAAGGHGMYALSSGGGTALIAQQTGTGPIFQCYNGGTVVFEVDSTGPTGISLFELTNSVYAHELDSSGHVGTTGGSAPTVAVTLGTLGTGGTVTATGNDAQFHLDWTLGTGNSASWQFTVTFSHAYANSNYIVAVTPTVNDSGPVVVTRSTTTVVIGAAGGNAGGVDVIVRAKF